MNFNKKSTSVRTNITLLIIISILVVALIVVVLIAILPESQGGPLNNTSVNPPISTITVKTPYCEMKYPEQWKDQMTVKESKTDEALSEAFYADIAGAQYALFTIYFGNSAAGELFGYLSSDGDKIAVYIECHKLSEDNTLSDSEVSLFYSMMESVNEVAQSIAAAKGYFAA